MLVVDLDVSSRVVVDVSATTELWVCVTMTISVVPVVAWAAMKKAQSALPSLFAITALRH